MAEASKLGSKFTHLSRNVTQNVQKMSDKIGSEFKAKTTSRPVSSMSNVSFEFVVP